MTVLPSKDIVLDSVLREETSARVLRYQRNTDFAGQDRPQPPTREIAPVSPPNRWQTPHHRITGPFHPTTP